MVTEYLVLIVLFRKKKSIDEFSMISFIHGLKRFDEGSGSVVAFARSLEFLIKSFPGPSV